MMMNFENCFEYDLPESEYHARPELSSTQVRQLLKSGKHYRQGSNIGSETARLGSAAHNAILEGGDRIVTAPDRPRRSKADREWWAAFFTDQGADPAAVEEKPAAEWFPAFERSSGKILITATEKQHFAAMRESIWSNQLATELLSTGKPEVSMFAEINGVASKARTDVLNTAKHSLADVKTTPDATAAAFSRTISRYGYHVQACFYSRLYEALTGNWPEFYFIAIEKTAPFSCAVYQIRDDAMQHASEMIDQAIERYKLWSEQDHWPGLENDLDLFVFTERPAQTEDASLWA